MTFFLSGQPLQADTTVTLRGDEAHHLVGVRRTRKGERFALQDPEGRRFSAEVVDGQRREATVRVHEELAVPALPSVRLTVLQAAVKDKAAEWVIQKATELGVAEVAFFPTTHSPVARKEWESDRLRGRWERIAWEACKQCDRVAPPRLRALPSFEAALEGTGGGTDDGAPTVSWLLHRDGGRPAQAPRPVPGQARLLVGPEGGFTAEEIAHAEAAGFAPVRLGALVLRAETAAVAGAALMLFGA